MIGNRCWREASRTGLAVLAVPPAISALAAVAVVVTRHSAAAHRVVPGVLETLLPLAAGVATASAIGRDGARELQLSLPASYRATLAWRAGLVLAVVMVSGVLLTITTAAAGSWRGSPGMLAAQLVWLAPALFLAGLGAAACSLSGSAGLGAAAVGVLWLVEAGKPALFTGRPWQSLYLFANGRVPAAPFHSPGGPTAAWWQDRVTLCLAALALGAVTAALAGQADRRLGSAS